MQGLGIIILIVVFFWLIWPVISRWLKRKAMEKAEDYMRSQMGMPPRDRKNKRQGSAKENSSQENYYYQRQRRKPYSNENEPLIPKEYAEDVEFKETKDYSETTTNHHSTKKIETYNESQISDAEWTEVKEPRTK